MSRFAEFLPRSREVAQQYVYIVINCNIDKCELLYLQYFNTIIHFYSNAPFITFYLKRAIIEWLWDVQGPAKSKFNREYFQFGFEKIHLCVFQLHSQIAKLLQLILVQNGFQEHASCPCVLVHYGWRLHHNMNMSYSNWHGKYVNAFLFLPTMKNVSGEINIINI